MNKAGRNDPCPCGSGKKFKKCCEIARGRRKIQAQVISPTNANEAKKVSLSLFHRAVSHEPSGSVSSLFSKVHMPTAAQNPE